MLLLPRSRELRDALNLLKALNGDHAAYKTPGITVQHDSFHPRARNRPLPGGFRAGATISRADRARPRYFIPLSPRVILATFEQEGGEGGEEEEAAGKRQQRFRIRPLLQFTCAKKIPAVERRCIYGGPN